MSHSSHSHRPLALATALALAGACVVPAAAAEPIGDGVAPTYDEAYYATLDYYGNLTEGSVVKSYVLNGADTVTDHGTYDQVVNLTDHTEPTVQSGTTTFRFAGDSAPTHFYFEGKTAQPFETLPWTLSIHYTLNGVPTRAEDLPGKTGVVEILVDAIPNENASEYAKNNYTLEAMALFNQDDILSLEAPGAQVQLIGNLRAVLFLAFPGEEQHFAIRVGAEDFSFGGMTFLMVPATLSQLEEISKLSDRKDELEEDYHKLSDSLDTLLDAFGGMEGSLYATADGLDQLNQARGTISAGKGTVYDGTDALREDLRGIAALLDPVAEQVEAASKTVTDAKAVLNTMTDTALDLQDQLEDMEDALENLEDSDDVRQLIQDAANMKSSLNKLKSALESIDRIPSVQSPLAGQDIDAIRKNLPNVEAMEPGYRESTSTSMVSFYEYACEVLWQKYAAEHSITKETPDYGRYRQAFLDSVGSQAAKGLAAIYESWAPDPEAFEFLLDHSDTIDDLLDQLNTTTSGVSDAMEKIAGPTAAVVGKLANLCDDMDELTDLLEDAGDLSDAIRHSSKRLRSILDSTDELRTILNDYEPTAQESLKTLEDLSVTAAATVRDSEQLAADAEALLKTSGTQLDAGTKQTLSGLAAALRQAARSLSTTNDVKDAKANISSIIEDTWNEHTGDIDNLLNMDANAVAVSLTSPENPAPQSIQVVIRTQEIKAEEEKTEAAVKAAADNSTFWGRIAQMFKDFWAAITGIFR